MLIDTHCHLDFTEFDADRDAVLERAHQAGVERFINIGSSLAGSKRSVELAEKYDTIYAAVGIHPHEAASVTDEAMVELTALAWNEKVVAIGEVGLDYFRNLSSKEAQVAAFRKFIALAAELDLPVVLHAREANDEVLDILEAESDGAVRGVMHCFSGDAAILRRCLALGLHISYTCNLTYTGRAAREARETAKRVPVERLLLETDAPYLPPQELRGKVTRNEPASMVQLLDVWSELLGLSREDIARITTHNANALFGLDIGEESRITYEIRKSLYLNITNRCSNNCDFCIRNKTSFVKGHNLKLDREPTAMEILASVEDPTRYREIVFCGYGEPTMRLETVKEVAHVLKGSGARVRMVTNGHGDLINKRPIAAELAGLIDRVSVSLNTDSAGLYERFCKPAFGRGSYQAILDFITACVAKGIAVEVTCLDLPGVDARKCAEIAASLGATFRQRHVGIVG